MGLFRMSAYFPTKLNVRPVSLLAVLIGQTRGDVISVQNLSVAGNDGPSATVALHVTEGEHLVERLNDVELAFMK